MATEYKIIQDEGFKLHLDCSDLAMGRHTSFADKSLREFQQIAALHVKALNKALDGLDASKIRMHVCWGPHFEGQCAEVPLSEILEIIISAAPKFLAIEACSPRHGHEYEIWKRRKLPADKAPRGQCCQGDWFTCC